MILCFYFYLCILYFVIPLVLPRSNCGANIYFHFYESKFTFIKMKSNNMFKNITLHNILAYSYIHGLYSCN
nr:MAG TPA: hypothetical protein [Caudoviricetes sp.]